MNYAKTKTQLLPLIQEEIARVAGSVKNSDGASLYDVIIYHNQDADRLYSFAEEAASNLRARLNFIDESTNTTNTITFAFRNEDMPAALQSPATIQITNYLVYYAVARWLINKRIQDRGAEYTALAKSAEEAAVTHILTRSTSSYYHHDNSD